MNAAKVERESTDTPLCCPRDAQQHKHARAQKNTACSEKYSLFSFQLLAALARALCRESDLVYHPQLLT
jgi:hypothetical protein